MHEESHMGHLKRKVGRREGCVGEIDNRFVNFQGDGMRVCVCVC